MRACPAGAKNENPRADLMLTITHHMHRMAMAPGAQDGTMAEMKLRREHVVGIRTDLPSCEVHFAPSGKSTTGSSIVYPCDNLLVLSDLSTAASGGSQSFIETTKPNNRLVAYSISNDGTLLALAENNNSSDNASVSLVTLYSLAATNKSSGPVTNTKKKKVIQIESGILHVSFVDSTHILVLGDGPDYNLTLWSTGTSSSLPASPGTRHPRHPGGCLASIKLATPSRKNIYRAKVSPTKDNAGNSLVCITGDGVLRLFRLSITNSSFRPVTVNLKRKQQNYISQLWLSSGQIALGTDTGEILIIENNATRAVLKLPEPHTVVNSLAESSRCDLVVGSDASTIHLYETFQDTKETPFQRKAFNSVANGVGRIDASIASLSVSVVDGREVIYAATTDERLVAVSLNSDEEESSCGMKKIKPAIPTFLSSRESTCANSISICLWQPLVAVSSYDAGTQSSCVQVWNYHTKKLEASQSFESCGPVQSICFHPSSFHIVVGTKEKVIVCNLVHRIARDSEGERNNDRCPSIIKASGQIDVASAVTVCQYSNGGQYLAVCCGATATIYDAFTLKVICVLRGHSTDLVAIKFQDRDQHFCTIGGDGVLCVWSIPSGKKVLRHVNALSSYKCAAIDDKFSRAIVGNANESTVSIELNLQGKTAQEEILDFANEVRGKLQLSSCGQLVVGTTTSDTEGDDESILITSLMDMEQTDVAPSIRQISSMQLFGQNLFVASSSGSMHHFTIVDMPKDQSPIEDTEVEPAYHAILSDQVLVSETDLVDRRVLIQSLEQQLAEQQQQNADDIQRLDNKCHDALEAIQEQSQLDDREHQRKCQEASEQRSKMEQDSEEAVSTLEKSHFAKMKDIEQTMEQKIASEIERTESMKSESVSKTREYREGMERMEHQNAIEMKQMSLDFNTRTENEVQLQAQISKQQEDLLEKHHRLMESLEATGDDEITGIMLERERELLVEQKATRQLREEQAILKAKLDSLMSDLDEQKDTIESLQEKEAELVASIDGARDYIRQRQSDMHSQGDQFSAGKDEEIDLKRKCTELNQRHACLEEDIAQRNKLLSQIEADIVDKEKTAAQIRADLTASKRAHSNVNLAIANLKDKALGLDRERQRQKSRIDEMAACTLELEEDIFGLISSKKNGHSEIKAKLLPLCTKYLKTVGDSSSRTSSVRLGTSSKRGREAKESESQRREQNLRKKIETIKAAMAKAEKKHAQDMARLRWQQKVLKQNLSEMGSSDDVPSDSSPLGKENSANNE